MHWRGKRFTLFDPLLASVSQHPIYDHFDPRRSSALESLTSILRCWLSTLAASQIRLDDIIDQGCLTPRQIHHDWTVCRVHTRALESVIGNLSKGLAVEEWNHNSSGASEVLLQDYIAVLQRSKHLSENLLVLMQQMSSIQSILESKKGAQSADSVRRSSLPMAPCERTVAKANLQIDFSRFCVPSSFFCHVVLRHKCPAARHGQDSYRLLCFNCFSSCMLEFLSSFQPQSLGASVVNRESCLGQARGYRFDIYQSF